MSVRTEKVVLTLQDDFSTPMARAAAATALANKELRDLSGTSTKAASDSDDLAKSTRSVGAETEKTAKKTREYTLDMAVADERAKRFKASLREQAAALVDQETNLRNVTEEAERNGDAFRKSGADIDRYSGRLRLITEAVSLLGPALIPIGAAGVPAVTALTAGLGAAAGAAGVALLAFNGMGDALDAIDAYRLEPTVDNLHEMQAAFDDLGPAGAEFARFLESLGPEIDRLQNMARSGLFPGLEEGIGNLLPLLPQVERIISNIATELGDLGADAGAALAGDRFTAFFDYLETDAAPTMAAFARSTGNVAEGLANLLVAFGPLTSDFTGGMERMTRSFATWADGLSRTDGFRDFVSYVRESGPQTVEFLGAIGNAFVGIIRAAAPFGQAVLPALTSLANILAAIANSPVGPPLFTAAAGFLAVSRAATLASAGVTKFNAAAATTGGGLAGKVAGIAAAFGILGNELAKLNGSKVDLSELDKNLNAIADGGGADALDHITESLKMLSDSTPDAYEVPTVGGLFGNTPRDNAAELIAAYDDQLAALVESGNAEKASQIFDQIQEKLTGLSADTHEFTPFGQSAKDFDAYASALSSAASGTDQYAAANEIAAASARKTRTELRGLVAAMEEQASAALGAFDAVTQYGQALDAASDAAAKGKRGIDENTEAGRENREALSGLAAAWNNQSDAVRNNVGKYREARKSFIDTATAMGVPIEKARTLAARLMEIPKSVATQVTADTGRANANLNVLYARLAELRGSSVTTYIDVVTRSFGAKRADIPQPGSYATGGYTGPGGKYDLAGVVHRREYVMDSETTDRALPLLQAIHASKGRIFGYADGGQAGKPPNRGRSVFTFGNDTLSGPMPKTIKATEVAIKDLRGSVVEMGRDVRESSRGIKLETKERDRLSAIVDRNQDAVDKLNGLFEDLASAVRSNLTSDQFAKVEGVTNANPWASATASTADRLPTVDESIARLNQDTANAGAMFQAINTLISKGVTGGALKSILDQGLATSQMFAALDPQKLKEYQGAFDWRGVATGLTGQAAGNAVYGSDLVAANAELAESKADRREQTLAVKEITRQNAVAEKQRDRADKRLEQMNEHLADLRSELKKARGELESAHRGKR